MDYNPPRIIWEHNIESFRKVIKIQVESHTYIMFNNTWNSASDTYIHDPDCKCFKVEEKNKGK